MPGASNQESHAQRARPFSAFTEVLDTWDYEPNAIDADLAEMRDERDANAALLDDDVPSTMQGYVPLQLARSLDPVDWAALHNDERSPRTPSESPPPTCDVLPVRRLSPTRDDQPPAKRARLSLGPPLRRSIALPIRTADDRPILNTNSITPACIYLRPGAMFIGKQDYVVPPRRTARSEQPTPARLESWDVRVTVSTVDLAKGRLSGVITATNVPGRERGDAPTAAVITALEGDLLDGVNFGLYSDHLRTDRTVDLAHWRKLPGLSGCSEADLRAGRVKDDWLLMRWKEQAFMNEVSGTNFTIAGFYYSALNRLTGDVQALYYDVNTSQSLNLKPVLSATFDVQ